MAWELIYTSAPRGLKSGTSGFCTVACTAGLSAPMAMTLESLCGYRHLFPPGSPQAVLNPVVYSHLTCDTGGKLSHILSRIADAGTDYSGRTNKICHHLLLEHRELSPCGPVGLCQAEDFFHTRWEEPPVLFPKQRKISQLEASSCICHSWKIMTGDAGWGGVLAAAVIHKYPVCVSFSPGQNLLPLFGEAIALLPTEDRWKGTFTTFFTRLPPEMNCLLKGVIADSGDEGVVRAIPGSIIIDLARGLSSINLFYNNALFRDWIDVARFGYSQQNSSSVIGSEESGKNTRVPSGGPPVFPAKMTADKKNDSIVANTLNQFGSPSVLNEFFEPLPGSENIPNQLPIISTENMIGENNHDFPMVSQPETGYLTDRYSIAGKSATAKKSRQERKIDLVLYSIMIIITIIVIGGISWFFLPPAFPTLTESVADSQEPISVIASGSSNKPSNDRVENSSPSLPPISPPLPVETPEKEEKEPEEKEEATIVSAVSPPAEAVKGSFPPAFQEIFDKISQIRFDSFRDDQLSLIPVVKIDDDSTKAFCLELLTLCRERALRLAVNVIPFLQFENWGTLDAEPAGVVDNTISIRLLWQHTNSQKSVCYFQLKIAPDGVQVGLGEKGNDYNPGEANYARFTLLQWYLIDGNGKSQTAEYTEHFLYKPIPLTELLSGLPVIPRRSPDMNLIGSPVTSERAIITVELSPATGTDEILETNQCWQQFYQRVFTPYTTKSLPTIIAPFLLKTDSNQKYPPFSLETASLFHLNRNRETPEILNAVEISLKYPDTDHPDLNKKTLPLTRIQP